MIMLQPADLEALVRFALAWSALGWVGRGVARGLLPGFPDRGRAFAPWLGLLWCSVLLWAPAHLGWLRFDAVGTRGMVGLFLALTAMVPWIAGRAGDRRGGLRELFAPGLPTFVFWGFFLLWVR